MSASQIFNVVVGTAGHINHGKSALVRRLTGTDPDRLKEERERGLTIDLGFASWRLPDGRRVGIIDVPGHEQFVKNMVAGATGIDLVLLVIEANEGVKPQTREHLEIMQLLGIRRGLVVISKIDLVDPDLVELAVEDARGFLAGTFLEGAPIVPVSVVTDQGLDLLTSTLAEIVNQTPPRDTTGLFRMPIQRVFSAKGFGTVVTGVPVSGQATKGDELEVLPPGLRGRVRSIQAYMEATEFARAGHSSALNLSDIDYREVHRGMVAASPGYFEAHNFYEAQFTYLASAAKPLANHAAIRFHTGTIEVLGWVYILERDALEPGECGLVQFKLEQAIVAGPGDRFVVRQVSPGITIGGGELVGLSDYRLKRKRDWIVERVRQKMATMDSPREQADVLAREAGPAGLSEADLRKRLAVPEQELVATLRGLEQEGELLRLGGARFVHRAVADELSGRLVGLLEEFHRANPRKLYCEGIELRNALRLDPVLFERLVSDLEKGGRLEREGGRVRQKGRAMALSDVERETYESILAVYRDPQKAFQTPRPDELPAILDTRMEKIQPMLDLAVERGELVRLDEHVLLARESYRQAMEIVVGEITQKGELISADFRDRLATTRKYIIPLLDHFDRIGLTTREGSQRILRRDHARVLEKEGVKPR